MCNLVKLIKSLKFENHTRATDNDPERVTGGYSCAFRVYLKNNTKTMDTVKAGSH